MPQPREKLQRDRQLGQDARRARPPLLRALQADVMAFVRAVRENVMILSSLRRDDIMARFRVRRAAFYAIHFWEKLFYMGTFIIMLLVSISMLQYSRLSELKRHCTSEWIFDTTAPYHPTNQVCVFADNSGKCFSSLATHEGVESYGYGIVKLDLQYHDPTVKNNTGVRPDHLYSYAPLELYFTQYVPNRANTISVSQLIRQKDLVLESNKKPLMVEEDGTLVLRIGDKPKILAQQSKGHYVFKARLPGGGCKCPDVAERCIFR